MYLLNLYVFSRIVFSKNLGYFGKLVWIVFGRYIFYIYGVGYNLEELIYFFWRGGEMVVRIVLPKYKMLLMKYLDFFGKMIWRSILEIFGGCIGKKKKVRALNEIVVFFR